MPSPLYFYKDGDRMDMKSIINDMSIALNNFEWGLRDDKRIDLESWNQEDSYLYEFKNKISDLISQLESLSIG